MGISNVADAGTRWFAVLKACKVYNYTAKLESSITVSSGSIGLGFGEASATLLGISYECHYGFGTCDESQQRFEKI